MRTPLLSFHCRPLALALALGSCAPLAAIGCAPAEDELPVLAPPAPEDGFQLAFTGVTAEPFSETWACSIYPIPIDAPAPVNRVEYLNNEGMHHMTLSTTGLTSGGDWAPGVYDCNELYGDASLMEDQIMFFGGSGTASDTMQLPQGVVANLPTGVDIIHEFHFVNPTDEPVELFSYVNGYTIPEGQVDEMIWGGQVRDEHINIPAADEQYTEWTRCVFNRDVEVLFLAGHTHQLGDEFRVRTFDGTTTGEEIFFNDDWHNPKITQYETPISLQAGEGFEYSCTWKNTTGEPVVYGSTSTDEMCNLAIVHTPFDLTAQCEVVESSDGVLWEG